MGVAWRQALSERIVANARAMYALRRLQRIDELGPIR
jgi:hypothetical protein